MVASDPRLDQKRRIKERGIWLVDLIVYGILAVNGVWMTWFTSKFIEENVKFQYAILALGLLLLIGGVAGFLGRVSTFWVIELPGLVAAMFGSGLYALVLLTSAASTGGTIVPGGFVVVAFLKCVHRYTELRIFLSEPAIEPFTARLTQLLRRRTKHTVPRKFY